MVHGILVSRVTFERFDAILNPILLCVTCFSLAQNIYSLLVF